MIKERPILFSTPMVQAILEGRKTQTRRIVKTKRILEPHEIIYKCAEDDYWIGTYNGHFAGHSSTRMNCPYGKPGDVIWVRETFGKRSEKAIASGFEQYFFKAGWDKCTDAGWKPSIHMPKDAARIWLEITEVRVERLQDVSEEDAVNEGIEEIKDACVFAAALPVGESRFYKHYHREKPKTKFYKRSVNDALASFRALWQSINGPESWQQNPYVWVVKFKILSTTCKPAAHA